MTAFCHSAVQYKLIQESKILIVIVLRHKEIRYV